jgi:hypothetical protein
MVLGARKSVPNASISWSTSNAAVLSHLSDPDQTECVS